MVLLRRPISSIGDLIYHCFIMPCVQRSQEVQEALLRKTFPGHQDSSPSDMKMSISIPPPGQFTRHPPPGQFTRHQDSSPATRTVHPPPGQFTLHWKIHPPPDSSPSNRTVHPPPGQLNLQDSSPSTRTVQPPPGQCTLLQDSSPSTRTASVCVSLCVCETFFFYLIVDRIH